MADKPKSQMAFAREYFTTRPMVEISHEQSKRDLEVAYMMATSKRFEDADRAIRKLHQEGFLIKVAKGIYMYDPTAVEEKTLQIFSEQQKREILERDGFKCAVCGLGKENGLSLQIDHIKPMELGGKATLENGQVLCSKHNFYKNKLNATEMSKKSFIRQLEQVRKESDQTEASKLISFYEEILSVYDKYQIDEHIDWDKS